MVNYIFVVHTSSSEGAVGSSGVTLGNHWVSNWNAKCQAGRIHFDSLYRVGIEPTTYQPTQGGRYKWITEFSPIFSTYKKKDFPLLSVWNIFTFFVCLSNLLNCNFLQLQQWRFLHVPGGETAEPDKNVFRLPPVCWHVFSLCRSLSSKSCHWTCTTPRTRSTNCLTPGNPRTAKLLWVTNTDR